MIKNILFDFDGVILDSMPVREYGFRKIFEEFDKDLVEKLLDFHNANGGLSRYVKIRYFYEELLGKNITEDDVKKIANNFSIIMKKELINKKYLITQTVEFLDKNYKNYNLHIVSGSDEVELRYLCDKLELDKYFDSINGSPTHKNDLVKNLLLKYKYKDNETALIGDSINDYEAAKINNIDFYGFNNISLIECSKTYIDDWNNIVFFDYGTGEISHSEENKTYYNMTDSSKDFEYLVFMDSRALSINDNSYDETIMMKLIEKLRSENKSYIAISRPKNIMIFASLLNFLENNKGLKFNKLITNLGFVDFTPKKQDIINDIKNQISCTYDINQLQFIKLDTYKLSNGNNEVLYGFKNDELYVKFLAEKLIKYFLKSVILNTPEITNSIKIQRQRPLSFFTQLKQTNTFINELSSMDTIGFTKCDIKDIFSDNQELYSYDAVHYTKDGHILIYNIFTKYLI